MKISTLVWAFLMAPVVLCAQSYQDKIVAAVITAEASSEGERGMKAVAEVIQRRAADKGQTYYQVVTAGRKKLHAFSCLNGTTPDKLYAKWRKDENYGKALEIVKLMATQSVGNATNRATHFTRKDEKPYWAKGKKPVAVIGEHAFYRLAY